MNDSELLFAIDTITDVFSRYYDYGIDKALRRVVKHTNFGGFADYGEMPGKKRIYVYDFSGGNAEANKNAYKNDRSLLEEMWDDPDMRPFAAEELFGSGDVENLGWMLVRVIKEQ